MDWLISLGDWGAAGAYLSPASSGASGLQGLGNALAAGSNQQTGLVTDAASSIATAAATGVAIGVSKIVNRGLSEAAEQAAAALVDAQQIFDRALNLDPDLASAAGELVDDAMTEAGNAEIASLKGSSYATPIIDAALIAHLALSLANGFGAPNGGTQLGSAAGELDWAVDRLATAGKTDGWTSPDAEPRYRNANAVQQERVAKIAEIDRKFEKALKAQATQVYELKGTFGYIKTAMNSAKILAMALNMAGPAGQAASVVLQTTTATACLLADASHQGMQHQNALTNATEFENLASAYQACQQP